MREQARREGEKNFTFVDLVMMVDFNPTKNNLERVLSIQNPTHFDVVASRKAKKPESKEDDRTAA
jgi:hypothetical protein